MSGSCGFLLWGGESVEYITVTVEGSGEYSEKHSRFLGFVTPCESETQAAELIADKRKKYWDARHVVYAYVLADGTARFSDDGEPHGTAGKPVLDVLSMSGIKNAVVTVVRYFGGILLGTGGLVRAYTAAAQAALDNAGKARTVRGNRYTVTVDYADYDKLAFLFKEFNAQVETPDFSEKIRVDFALKSDFADSFLEKAGKTFSSRVVPEFVENTEILEKI